MRTSGISLDTLRSAVRQRVSETSLRQAATEIEMSFSGLRSFLQGSAPQRQTREKLIRWYAERGSRRFPKEAVDSAIVALQCYFAAARDETERERRRSRVFDALRARD